MHMVTGKILRNISVSLMICIITACAGASAPDLPYSNQQKSNLTAGMVKKYIKPGGIVVGIFYTL